MYSLIRLADNGFTRDESHIIALSHVWMRLTCCFAQQTPDTIAGDCVSQLFTGHKTVAVMRKMVGYHAQDQQSMALNFTMSPQVCKILAAMQSQMALHNRETAVKPVASLSFPVDFLGMVVHLHRQVLAALSAARFQDPTAILRAHPAAKTMYTNTPPPLGLVGTFGHL